MRRYAFIVGVVLALAGALAFALTVDPQRPAQSFYRVRWEATQTGWTPERHIQAGNLLSQMGDLRGAAIHWGAANPTDEATLQRLSNAYIALQQWRSATDSLRALLTITPDSAFAHYYLGLILAPSDPIQAAQHLDRVNQPPSFAQTAALVLVEITQNPADPALGVRVGRALLLQNEHALAERAFRHASDWNMTDALSLAYIGLARELQGMDGQAWIDSALAQAPDSGGVHYVHGLYLRESGADDLSRDAFAQAVQLNPQEPAYYAELGTTYQRLGDLSTAAYWLNYAVQIAESAGPYVRRLARFYIQESYPIAPDTLRTLLEQAPTEVDAIALYGWTLHLNGESERAIAQINSVLERTPQNPEALYYKAQILFDLGRFAEAIPVLDDLAQIASRHQAWAVELRQVLSSP